MRTRTTRFAAQVLGWYITNGRQLPWREDATPYATWVSEIMLQQTRVETVVPYFDRWMRRFPTVQHLARASQQAVLLLWEGLGYYSRARNLHRSAGIVVREFGGVIPSNLQALRGLPGIGGYTAAAIASIAFGLDEIALDGNIRRVLWRALVIDNVVKGKVDDRRLLRAAARHVPTGRAGDFNQGLMDIGATICLPRNPKCGICPVARLCRARRQGRVGPLPSGQRRPIPHLLQAAAVARRRGTVLLALRQEAGLLGGLWEFPKMTVGDGAEKLHVNGRKMQKALHRAYAISIRDPVLMGVINHAYSHFRVTVHAFDCKTTAFSAGGRLKWVSHRQLPHLPMGRVDRQIADHVLSKKW